MNPAKRRGGLATTGKVGVVVIVVVLALGAAYLALSPSGGGSHSTSSARTQLSTISNSNGGSAGGGGGNQTLVLLSLFGTISQMQLQDKSIVPDPDGPIINVQTFQYKVLGTASLNSTQYTKVQFSQTPSVGGGDIIAWFDPTGTVNRLDILGDRNYTGSTATVLAKTYVSSFTAIPIITNNATLLSLLSKTTENTTTIGSTQVNLTTYHLKAPTSTYTKIIAEYATIPGTNVRLIVYLDELTSDGVETVAQVLSLTR